VSLYSYERKDYNEESENKNKGINDDLDSYCEEGDFDDSTVAYPVEGIFENHTEEGNMNDGDDELSSKFELKCKSSEKIEDAVENNNLISRGFLKSKTLLSDDVHDYFTKITASTSNDIEKDKENLNIKKRRKRVEKTRREGIVRRGKWSLGSKIGNGTFGVVHIGLNMQSGELMAVKIVEMSARAMKDIRLEVELLKSLKHENIVHYLGAEITSQRLHIFQEWVPGGSVTTLLHKFGPFSTAVMRTYLSQILTGLAFLHDNRILHRDIKGGNVLVNDKGIVKLADFGAAKRLKHEHSDMMESLTIKGTPYYMAPEVFQERYNNKADIWSVGCVAFQMATGQPPWKNEGLASPMELHLHLQNTKGLPTIEWPADGPVRESISKNLFENMLKHCFRRAPIKRPSAQGLHADPFFSLVSSSDEDSSQSRALFSPGDSLSTFTPALQQSASNTPSHLSKAVSSLSSNTPFLSPPMPSKIKLNTLVNISPLPESPALNSSEWPIWARDQLKKDISSPCMPRSKLKQNSMTDSLAISADTTLMNPFSRKASDLSKGTISSFSLEGIRFIDDTKSFLQEES